MDLNDLNIFQTVAAHGSVSKAAAELSYVQSNVTARIKLLEKELQTPLFNRHKRGMILNTEGKRLLQYTKSILSQFEEMKHAFQNTSAPSGVLEIGIVETVIALPAILHAYYSKYPDVELSLKAGVTESLVQEVAEMRLDGAFVTGPVKHPLIEQFDVFQEKLVLVSQGDDFSVEDLTTRPLLLYKKGCGYRGRLETWLKMEGIIPKQIMEFGTFETIIGSVAAGIGMTVFPESSISGLVSQGLVCGHAMPEPYNEVTTVFIRRKEAFVTSTLQSFIHEIITQTEA
ncbi:HTH-type transcriptional regulator GltR [Paenibacillus polymyxa E681]|uniref:LysR family transcriptional regulator n=1 Tax=Paenibacillus polymyxa TaxID=1406 RepID=UPI0001E32102|nr:LysR family transcriptional regulator [Paenibacillus polymyxa]ADM72316.1 LysR family transcriptional regulator [Paenibacillus polymyxa E681]QNV59341.1 HTH-type transcriptional regulator GltR [Paenibacillus polymyxa E681]QNV64167.1 HTH-type transcriptional regulator GltR [Paenibacillus polymyxa E681]